MSELVDDAALLALATALERLAEELASTRRVLLDRADAARVDWAGTSRRWFDGEADAVVGALTRSALECRITADQVRHAASRASLPVS